MQALCLLRRVWLARDNYSWTDLRQRISLAPNRLQNHHGFVPVLCLHKKWPLHLLSIFFNSHLQSVVSLRFLPISLNKPLSAIAFLCSAFIYSMCWMCDSLLRFWFSLFVRFKSFEFFFSLFFWWKIIMEMDVEHRGKVQRGRSKV